MNKKLWFESNYKNYYTLYKNYASNNFAPTNKNDETNLVNLAALCPGTGGACVYQARALYNSVFNYGLSFFDCGGSRSRIANNENSKLLNSQWDLNLYPNPASNIVTIQNSMANEQIYLEITDLSGRTLLSQDVKLSGFYATISLSLLEGAYMVTMINSKNEKLIKKLLIHD